MGDEVISAGIVTFRMKNDEIEFILLDHGTHKSHPKGTVENDELLVDTALRELNEETALQLMLISTEPVVVINYNIEKAGKLITKYVHYFAGICYFHQEVMLSDEHVDFQWTNIKSRRRAITHYGDKYALKKAVEWLFSYDGAILLASDQLAMIY